MNEARETFVKILRNLQTELSELLHCSGD